jgi:hypothetical protein
VFPSVSLSPVIYFTLFLLFTYITSLLILTTFRSSLLVSFCLFPFSSLSVFLFISYLTSFLLVSYLIIVVCLLLSLVLFLSSSLSFFLYFFCHISLSRDSVVGTATGYRLDDRRVEVRVPVGSRVYFSMSSRPTLRPTQPPLQ